MIAAFSHFKLGLLALITLVALAGVALVFGLRKRPTDTYHTYFDETVQGLEIGAQVKFRGIKIGRVTGVDLAPDRRHVHVALAIDRTRAKSLALEREPAVRAAIASQGVTGVKLVDIDVVDPKKNPPPALPFPVATPYLPSTQSFLVGIQEGISEVGESLPVLKDRIVASFDRIDRAVESIDQLVRDARDAQLPATLANTLRKFSGTATKLDRLVDQVRAGDGVLAAARRASDSLASLGTETREVTADLAHTLDEISDAARGVRELVETLERQPDMIVRGRAGEER